MPRILNISSQRQKHYFEDDKKFHGCCCLLGRVIHIEDGIRFFSPFLKTLQTSVHCKERMVMEFRENPTTEEFMIKLLFFFSVCKNSFVNSESNKMIGIM